jgi:hypothetical protein
MPMVATAKVAVPALAPLGCAAVNRKNLIDFDFPSTQGAKESALTCFDSLRHLNALLRSFYALFTQFLRSFYAVFTYFYIFLYPFSDQSVRSGPNVIKLFTEVISLFS